MSTTIEAARDFDREHVNWTCNVFNSVVMALMFGVGFLLLTQIVAFSASLDTLTGITRSESFILVSRVAASIVLLLVAKDLAVAALAFGQITKSDKVEVASATFVGQPKVTTIVPAFNESLTIEDTISSLVDLEYANHEIIVVDDGSTDDTLVKANIAAEKAPSGLVRVISQANGGKWKALNTGFAEASGEFILCIDSDSILKPDALRLMVPHFRDPAVASVSGQVQVRNKETFIARLQALEYLVANGSMRTAQSGSGCVLIVPGPIGLFRRTALEEVQTNYFTDEGAGTGPFSEHTFAEDFELSVMICANGGRIVYEPQACALTRVPDNTRALLSQRYRWIRGAMQVASRYRREKWGKRSSTGMLGRWMALSTVGDLYVVPFCGLLLIGATIWSLMLGEVHAMLSLWTMVLAIHACAALMFIRAQGESMSLALLSPLQSLYGAVLISSVWTHAVADHVRGRAMKW